MVNVNESIIKPLRPKDGWIKGPSVPWEVTFGYPAETWQFIERGLRVISSVEAIDEKLGPEYHISISRAGQTGGLMRCSSQDAKWVLRQFGAEDAEEDNHVPSGVVRNFWRPVADRLSGYQCPCKDLEPAMVEDKGDFVWRGIST